MFRITLSCLIIATCLFSLSWNPSTNLSLLERWVYGYQAASHKRQIRRRERMAFREQLQRERLELRNARQRGPAAPPAAPGRRRSQLDAAADDFVQQMLSEDEQDPRS